MKWGNIRDKKLPSPCTRLRPTPSKVGAGQGPVTIPTYTQYSEIF